MLRFRPMLVPTLWLVPALVLLIGLGIWQVQRLHWKENLIATVNARIAAPAIPLGEALGQGIGRNEWRHVSASGKFLNGKEIYLFASSREGEPGEHVITPFVLDDGRMVLIDRGFVPENLRDPATRTAGQLQGRQAVTGVLRLSQDPGFFTPNPDFAKRQWFVRDVAGMSGMAGVRVAAPVMIEADATANPGGWPKGGQTRVDFPNNHLQYAITWFGLAIALTVIYLTYHFNHGRLGVGRKRE